MFRIVIPDSLSILALNLLERKKKGLYDKKGLNRTLFLSISGDKPVHNLVDYCDYRHQICG